MEKLLDKISELKDFYDYEREKNRFNIITALHKERDEENLHSRIISYLLSPSSGHGMNETYITLFVRNTLKLSEDEFNLSKVLVLPNENFKSEYKYIDILIVSKSKSQAIIIENKIDAKDSNNECKRDGYKGQLERYYSTIKTGIDKDENACPEHQSNNVYVYYLALNKQPTDFSIGILKNEPNSWGPESILSYDSHIREWLKSCIEATPNEKTLVKNLIEHYLKLIDKMTHNDIPVEERLKLKDMLAERIKESKYLIENFKHVKWHTVHEFWAGLKLKMEAQYQNVSFFPEENGEFDKFLGKVSHQNKEVNHGILFDINGQKAYISGLGKLSWGIIEQKKWANFSSENVEDINFSDFSSESTYLLINKQNMNEAIEAIAVEILESEKDNFRNLKLI